MKYSSLCTRTVLTVIMSLAAQPLILSIDAPVVTGDDYSVFARAAQGVGKVATASLYGAGNAATWALKGLAKKIADKSDLLAENHPVICAALVAGGFYGIYCLYKKFVPGKGSGFRQIWQRRRKSNEKEEVLVHPNILRG